MVQPKRTSTWQSELRMTVWGGKKAAPLYIRTDHLVRVVCVTNDVWELEPKGARWSLGLDAVR